MAKNHQTSMAKSIPHAVGASTLASLEGSTTSAAATAGASGGLKTGKQYTGQYLYDRFVDSPNKEEQTKMAIVRQMATALDTNSYKTLLSDFVAIARGYLDNAKERNDSPALIAELSAKFKTAQNHQSVMRSAYGAINFALPELEEQGYTSETGYQLVRVMANAALAAKKIKWDGSAIPDSVTVDRRKSAKQETQALEAVMAETPRNSGESLKQYLERVNGQVDTKIEQVRKDAEQARIKALALRFRELAGSLIDEVIEMVQTMPAAEEGPLTVAGSVAVQDDAVKH